MSDKDIKNKVLEVKNLRISFNTLNGTVKAVRGISFDLYKGRTLAIVGESGSGKSVTSRAIMGLLANNKIVEEGEILYDGKDLLRTPEDELVKIRGSRISMIFQDPLSSLNPIMKIGKQITESMEIKSKASKKEGKQNYNKLIKALNDFNKEKHLLQNFNECLKEYEKSFTDGSSFNNSDFNKLIEEVLKDKNEVRKESSKEVDDVLESIVKNNFVNDEEMNVIELLKIYNVLKKLIPKCENTLRRGKDVEVSTFLISYKHFINEYKEALKRESDQLKADEKDKKLVAKGKKPLQDSIKAQAFGSEIDTSHQSVAKKFAKLINDLRIHLKTLENKEFSDAEKRVNNFLEFLKESFIDMNQKHTKKEFVDKAIKLMKEVGIPEPEKRIKQYPFQFSGGMRQRIVIAIALASNPEVLICDEPTTALDVTIQAQILELINSLKEKRNLSIIFITHNLGVVANMADDIAVMYAGKIIEYGTLEDIFFEPKHPYTWALLSSMPDLDTKDRLDAIPGTPPNMIIPPKGDAFAARNKYAMKIDFEKEPPLFKISDSHYAATWLLAPQAPKVDMPEGLANRIARMKKDGKANAE